ncbi:MAG: transglycosylase SLT domain-containing protein [Myxococcaceae bacterium]
MCRHALGLSLLLLAPMALAEPEAEPRLGQGMDAEEAPPPDARPAAGPAEPLGAGEEEAPPTQTARGELPGFIAVDNPAFPPPAMDRAPDAIGGWLGPEALEPYFAEPPFSEARAAFDRGDFPRASRLLQGAQSDGLPARFLGALVDTETGNDERAASQFTALADAYPALSDRCLYLAARIRERALHGLAAEDLYARVPRHSRFWVSAQLAMVRLQAKRGNLDRARHTLRTLASPESRVGKEALPDVLWELATMLGEGSAERQSVLERLWARFPGTSVAKRAETQLKVAGPSLAAQVERAESLIEGHQNRAGRRLLEPLVSKLRLPDPLACRAHFSLGKALRKERSHSRAIEVLRPVAAACAERELLSRALYVLGTSESIVAQEAGVATYERLAREFPEHPFADDALFYAADLEVKTGRLESALARLSDVASRYPSGDFAAEALFKAFWVHRSQGELGAALDVLERIDLRFGEADEPYEVERARYWKARTLMSMGRPEEGKAIWETLALERPTTYYGIRSAEELRAPRPLLPERRVAEEKPRQAGALLADPHFVAGVELLRMGLLDSAAVELLLSFREDWPADGLRLLATLLSRAGDVKSAHAVARAALKKRHGKPGAEADRSVWDIAYPRAFRELIEKHAQAAGIDPDLLQGLMREESALDPKALSWAGALGLTQLMPSTARSVAAQLRLPRPSAARLLEPDINIRLGAHYLGQLVRRFGGNLYLGIAAYNAGAGQVERWLAARAPEPLDAWVEEIPVAETRGYVKRVLRSYRTYQLLYPKSGAVSATQASRNNVR